MSEANEQRSGESNASLCSGSAWKAPANGPDVQGTGLPGFAELRARCAKRYREATQQGNWLAAWALASVLADIDAIEANAKSGS
jgi:hypothetical protein